MAVCAPERFEWLINGLRYLSKLTFAEERHMAIGTTRSEQLHAQLNALFRNTVQISKRMLAAEVRAWICGEKRVFQRAAASKLSKRMARADVAASVWSSLVVFSEGAWGARRNAFFTPWESA